MFLKFRQEKQKLSQGYKYIIGCDEVGRGSLAGPVVAAAVAFDLSDKSFEQQHSDWLAEIRDSKELLPVKRSILAELICRYSLSWGIGAVNPTIIDEINVHQASLRAMKLAIHDLERKVSLETSPGRLTKKFVFIDGRFTIPGLDYDQEAVVRGDAFVLSISAASIVAKVYRDNLMIKLHKKFPDYDLAQHKGYSTPRHIEQIKYFGLSPIHRVSFCDNIV